MTDNPSNVIAAGETKLMSKCKRKQTADVCIELVAGIGGLIGSWRIGVNESAGCGSILSMLSC
jgi:hypothetical protein